MAVKVFIAKHVTRTFKFPGLMHLVRDMYGKDTLEELLTGDLLSGETKRVNIGAHEAFLITGGRGEIISYLEGYSDTLSFHCMAPIMVAVFREKKIFGKDMSCVKIISGIGSKCDDGATYTDISDQLNFQPGHIVYRNKIGFHRETNGYVPYKPPKRLRGGSCEFAPCLLADILRVLMGKTKESWPEAPPGLKIGGHRK